jgi:hypothetical protein
MARNAGLQANSVPLAFSQNSLVAWLVFSFPRDLNIKLEKKLAHQTMFFFPIHVPYHLFNEYSLVPF